MSNKKSAKRTKIIKSRQDIMWHYISWLLSNITSTAAVYDKQFMELFEQLDSYVENKIAVDNRDITDIYVIVESVLPNCK